MPPKRKPEGQSAPPSKKPRFSYFQDARQIAAQTSESAYGNGELDVNKFVKAREYEIKALENGMRKARTTLSSRAFQTVPRELRRRTASHNVKRVPKRLQKRAKREMQQDNTPTVNSKTRKPSGHKRLRLETAARKQKASASGKAKIAQKRSDAISHLSGPIAIRMPHVKKDKLAAPPRPKAKFRKRQKEKTWLPTHMFHTKRAHMTPPKSPLWRMALPLSPTQKCYRPTHRAANARSAVAWDMSYISTIALRGTQDTLEVLLQSFGVGGQETSWWRQAKARKWLSGKRSWSGFVNKANSTPANTIAPVTIIWDPAHAFEQPEEGKKRPRRQVFLRVHPAAFLQLWEELLAASKSYKPKITVEDLRFEIGSIEITGPSASEALVGVLKPVGEGSQLTVASSVWNRLNCVDNSGILPADSLLAFDVADPRIAYPPKTVKHTASAAEHGELLRVLSEWPPDKSDEPIHLFERSARVIASRRLPSQKSINRRKGQADPGAYPDALSTDPQIPVLVLASKSPTAQAQGSMTVLLPWKCVLPVWYCLMHYPLHSGGNIRFGGLQQKRQLAYEAGVPWFPGDFPGTTAGAAWEQQESTKRKTTWAKRPKSKRVAWESVDLGEGRRGEVGDGWACDWQKLKTIVRGSPAIEAVQISAAAARKQIDQPLSTSIATEASVLRLANVEISMVDKGVPNECARIYRLPTTDEQLRLQWLSVSSRASRLEKKKRPRALTPAQQLVQGNFDRAELAAWLLAGDTSEPTPQGPRVPDEVDMIGFSTAGNFNLSSGKGSCIASVAVERLQPSRDKDLCIVRESGNGHARIGRWRLV